ncbi:hypothetical protein ABH963_002968 [Bacillus sp. RC55]|nr:hypothetical protein IKK_02626 [Bacillus mycoides]
MKYMNRIAGVMLTILLVVTACSNGEQIKEISHIEPGAFKNIWGHTLEIIPMCLRLLQTYLVVKQFKV